MANTMPRSFRIPPELFERALQKTRADPDPAITLTSVVVTALQTYTDTPKHSQRWKRETIMSYSDALETTYYCDVLGDAYRVEIFADIDADSPRDYDTNLATLSTVGRYISPDTGGMSNFTRYLPDEYLEWDGRDCEIDTRRASKYLALQGDDILAYSWLNNSESGLVAYGPGEQSRRVNGLGVITRETFARECTMSDDAADIAAGYLVDEVDSYRKWQMGEYVGAVISAREDGQWVQGDDSCWGFESVDSAMQYANEVIGTLDNETTEDDIATAEDDAAEAVEDNALAELAESRY